MMFFDGPSARVSRYMRRIDAESLDKDELAHEHKSGVCFSNLLFNEVGWFVDRKHESNGEPDYKKPRQPRRAGRGPLFTCRMMEEQIFSNENGRFRNWWYADLYDDLIVFYAPFRGGEKGASLVKAWRRYNQVWRNEEYLAPRLHSRWHSSQARQRHDFHSDKADCYGCHHKKRIRCEGHYGITPEKN